MQEGGWIFAWAFNSGAFDDYQRRRSSPIDGQQEVNVAGKDSIQLPICVRPSLDDQVTLAIEESGKSNQEWFRDALAAAVGSTRALEPNTNVQEISDMKLEAMQAEIVRLKEHLADARAQRGAANGSNERLETLLAQSQATVGTMTRALPAGRETPWCRRILARA